MPLFKGKKSFFKQSKEEALETEMQPLIDKEAKKKEKLPTIYIEKEIAEELYKEFDDKRLSIQRTMISEGILYTRKKDIKITFPTDIQKNIVNPYLDSLAKRLKEKGFNPGNLGAVYDEKKQLYSIPSITNIEELVTLLKNIKDSIQSIQPNNDASSSAPSGP